MNQVSISVCQKYPRLYQKLQGDLESEIKQNTNFLKDVELSAPPEGRHLM